MANLSLRRPDTSAVLATATAAADAPLSYDNVCGTRDSREMLLGRIGEGWFWDERSRAIGRGEETFRRARQALQSWSQFDLPWVRPIQRDVPIEVGAMFAFLSWQAGVWSTNICRVVDVYEREDDTHRHFSFAYGTVAPHVLRGEERFILDWDRQTDQVFFRIRKFSRPATWLIRLVTPLTRYMQSRFTADALARMQQAVTP